MRVGEASHPGPGSLANVFRHAGVLSTGLDFASTGGVQAASGASSGEAAAGGASSGASGGGGTAPPGAVPHHHAPKLHKHAAGARSLMELMMMSTSWSPEYLRLGLQALVLKI